MRFIAFFSCLPFCAAAQVWTQLPDFPGTARDDAAAFVVGGKLYMGTGMEVGWGLTTDWWCFDPQAEGWTGIASLPATPRQYCTAFTVNDTAYLFGGLDANGPLNELWAYHPSTDSWEEKASLPADGRFACAAFGGVDRGVIASGMMANNVPTNEAWQYVAADDAWEAITPVPGPARHRAAFFDLDGGLLIAGGADADGDPLADAWHYPLSPETGEWNEMPDLPAARWGADGSGGVLPVVCGGASSGSDMHADVWRFDGAQWEPLSSFPPGGRRGAVGAAIGADLYYGLGLDGGLQRHNDLWRIEVVTSVPEPEVPSLSVYPNPGNDHLTVRVPSGGGPIVITDAMGRTVRSERVQNGLVHLSVGDLSSGTYMVRMTLTVGTIAMARWVKL